MLRSDSRLTLSGAIFDAPSKRAQLKKTEAEISDPDFWNQPEKGQRIMQERKRLEVKVKDDAATANPTTSSSGLSAVH